MKFKVTGGTCTIDKEFFPIINQYRWHIDNYGYVITTLWCKKEKRTGERFKMHRVVSLMQNSKVRVDHINGNPSDNRLINLRPVTHAQNLWNRKFCKNNKVGFKGVCVDKRRNTWKAEISKNRVRFYIGNFKTKELAAAVWNRAAKIMHGEYAYQNKIQDLKKIALASKTVMSDKLLREKLHEI
jgi:hypothetical protein